jgi:D-3-phosphoglycerate dehydrogenase
MSETIAPLIADLLESIAREPRPYAEVLDAWRTSCPRLPVWEEAVERHLLTFDNSRERTVGLTAAGRAYLRAIGRNRT